jgi:hypothetical protein
MEGVMEESVNARAPAHLWIVGALSLLWNGSGAYDYLMTRSKGAAYVDSMMPGTGEAVVAYINSFPIWASFGWGLGVWMGLAGSILLLVRHRLAVIAFGLSLAGAILGIGYQLMRPADIPAMHQGFNVVVPYLVILIALALYLYSRAQLRKGVLR